MTNAMGAPTAPLDSLRTWWDEGHSWDEYLRSEVVEHRDLWEGVYRGSSVPDWAIEQLEDLGRNWRLLVIAEDWCGDASNLVPIFGRLAEASARVEVRIVKRDEHPELMDLYLTHESRSIPIVAILDDECRPRGRWGPRPAELQELVLREKRAGKRPNADIYRETRRWYARDRGETTLREVLEVMARAV